MRVSRKGLCGASVTGKSADRTRLDVTKHRSHIDTAWLWPFSVTQQKSARSWSTQCDLIDRYPEHRFSATQAQQFKWLEQQYPTLFERIKGKISEGTFQPVGATWVEMDANMPSGEALCRQFLYGQRYFESRFGKRCETFVLPDTFGYSSQLPQIARLSGCRNFFTQKISWNAVNNFPHTTFNWVGLDSSQILTHMTPVNNYNSQCNIDDIRRGATGHKNLEVTSQSLLLFGNGDGGGGPTPPMLEKLRRARAIAKQSDAGGQVPLVRMGGSFEQFYDAVREETVGGTRLPNWRGELYAEFHRGTYTSHGAIKKGNRKSEILMRDVEAAATMASLMDSSYRYPKAKIDAAWEDLLVCQFHDVLPGSGIAMIYDDAMVKYDGIRKSMLAVLDDAYDVLMPDSSVEPTAENDAPMSPPLFTESQSDGASASSMTRSQISSSSDAPTAIAYEVDGGFILKSDAVKMTIREGRIVSMYDKVNDRELIPEGQTGGMVIMEDHPNYWDAWDVDQFHLEKQEHLRFDQVRALRSGSATAALSSVVHVGQSRLDVEIMIDTTGSRAKDALPMIRFNASVDWREKHRFLKFELPVTMNADTATFDTQFGVVSRPTHRNTSWDAAK